MTDRVAIVLAGREVTARIGQTLLEVALENGIDLDHACGGVCACSTCHVKILQGADAFNEASEDEEDQLDSARDVRIVDLGVDSG